MRVAIKSLIAISIVLIALFAGVFWFLNSEIFYARVIPRLAEPWLQGGKIAVLKYGSHSFRFPCRFVLKNIRVKIEHKDHPADFLIQELYAAYSVLSPVRELNIHLRNLTGEMVPCRIEGLDFNGWMRFDSSSGLTVDGNLAARAMNLYQMDGTHVLASLKGPKGMLDIFRVSANGYGGRILAEISLDYLSGMSYSMKLKLDDIDLKKMRSAYPDVFSQIDGRLSGDVLVTGRGEKVGFLKADLDIPRGGKLKASLLGFIAGYLPPSTQKKELEVLIAAGGDVPFEQGILSLQSVRDDQLATTVALKSEKFNLDMNIGVDIRLDGGFQNLFQLMQKTFKE